MSAIFIYTGVEKIKTTHHYSYRRFQASFARASTVLPLCRCILAERERETPWCGMRREMLKGERGNFSCLTDGSAYN